MSTTACGGDVQACTTTDASGACTALVYKYAGKEHACASCGDCAQALTEVARACGDGGALGDAGSGFDGSAFGDATSPPDASGRDGAGPATQCGAPESCASGGAYALCVTVAGGACADEAYRFDDGTTIDCAGCSDCSAAQLAVASRCSTSPLDASADAHPCSLPSALHPEAEAGVYCPFTTAGAVTCVAGQQCCEAPPGSGSVSTCQAAGSACPIAGSSAWACEDALDCAGNAAGPVCCGSGAVVLDTTCGVRYGKGFTGSHCAQSCSASEVRVCTSQAQCAVGTTCTPFKTQGLGLGACL